MVDLATGILSPIVSIVGKLMRLGSKLKVNEQTLKELSDILGELKFKI